MGRQARSYFTYVMDETISYWSGSTTYKVHATTYNGGTAWGNSVYGLDGATASSITKGGKKMTLKKGMVYLLVLAILLTGMYIFISSGGFVMNATTGITEDSPVATEYLYFGHNIGWEGPVKPTIQDVQLMNKAGKIIDLNQYPSLAIYLEETGNLGLIGESDLQEKKYQFISPKGYRMKNEYINVVIKTEMDLDLLEDINQLVITYSLLGRTNIQYINIQLIR